MAVVLPGVYCVTKDKPYEVESSYYLDFQIQSALISIHCLESKIDISNTLFHSKAEYYHFYTDHLLFSLGQISNRFLFTNKDTEIDREHKNINRNNFQFTEEKYPILSDKKARNTIEHIDEYDNQTILKLGGVGGSNYIDSDTDTVLATELRNRRTTHIYTLDLIKNELLIFKKNSEVTVDLKELKQELLSLQTDVKWLLDMATSMY